jgi:hypothetical protein
MDSGAIHSVLGRQIDHSSAVEAALTDDVSLLVGELRAAVPLAEHGPGVRGMTAPPDGVTDVVSMRSPRQVVEVAARRVIARMPRDWMQLAGRHLEQRSTETPVLAADVDLPVPVVVPTSLPVARSGTTNSETWSVR